MSQYHPVLYRLTQCVFTPDVLAKHVILNNSWDSFIHQVDFGLPTSRLHLSLLPMPFFGSLTSARVFVLSLNPGLHFADYFAEFCVPDFRKELVKTHKQNLDDGLPFIWLNPRFAWHPGFSYWYGKFGALVNSFARQTGVVRVDALSFFSKSLALVELLPYHSISFGMPDRIIRQLRSVRLARSFVSEILIPRAVAGDALLVVVRKAKAWALPFHSNIIAYDGTESRPAHLSLRSRGGAAILSYLSTAWQTTQNK